MSKEPDGEAQAGGPPSDLRIGLAFLVSFGGFVALLFLPAGHLDWGAGWLYVAIMMVSMGVNYAYLRRMNPELIEHRMRFGKGTKTWDKVWMACIGPVWVSIYVVAGLDAGRFGWSAMPLELWAVGLALFVPGTMILTWSMVVNPFFEKTVRIQAERGHLVIDTGPYQFVRHPGYLGVFCWLFSAPLLLGSWWAFVPAILSAVLLIVRTALEDKTLHEELPGYPEYAGRTRFRLIPYLW